MPRKSGDDRIGAWLRLRWRLVRPIERLRARHGQRRFAGKFIAVTGSCGKTTTAFLIDQFLAPSGTTRLGIYQNVEIDALRIMRRLDRPIDYVVQEVAVYRPGDMALVAGILRVDVAVITAVGLDHLTTFRTLEAVAHEKGMLAELADPAGVVCLNADDPNVAAMRGRTRARVLTFGRSASADVRAENVRSAWPERLSFDLVIGERRWPVVTRYVGTSMLTNIVGAFCAAHALEADVGAAVARLAGLQPLPGRMSVVDATDGKSYVLDTVKASGWSTRALMIELANWGGVRPIVVLGNVSDIGNHATGKRRRLVRAALKNAALVIGAGNMQGAASAVAHTDGRTDVVGVGSFEEAARLIARRPPGSLVLLKSTVSLGLDRFVALAEAASAKQGSIKTGAADR